MKKRQKGTKVNIDGWQHKGVMSFFYEIEILIPSIFPSLDKCEILVCYRNGKKWLYWGSSLRQFIKLEWMRKGVMSIPLSDEGFKPSCWINCGGGLITQLLGLLLLLLLLLLYCCCCIISVFIEPTWRKGEGWDRAGISPSWLQP